MLGMKTLILVIGAVFGAAIGLALAPPIEVVEAADYLAVPKIENTCNGWVVQETGPDHYWDTDETDESTYTADYWTVETMAENGGTTRSEPAGRGETISVQPSPSRYVNVAWWDSDRPGEPQELSRVAALVEDC